MYYLNAIYPPCQNDNGYKGNDAICHSQRVLRLPLDRQS